MEKMTLEALESAACLAAGAMALGTVHLAMGKLAEMHELIAAGDIKVPADPEFQAMAKIAEAAAAFIAVVKAEKAKAGL